MTTTRVGSQRADGTDQLPGDDPSSPQTDHLRESPPPRARTGLVVHSSPSTVWFGPRGPESVERELTRFLGLHNGVGVLQWPRDTDRAAHLSELGIPCLWLVSELDDLPPIQSSLQEWLPRTASDDEVHVCLERLSERGAARRQAASLELDAEGWLHLGDYRVHLAPATVRLAAVLIDHFDEAVDDSVFCGESGTAASRWTSSLSSDMIHLDQFVNPLGLEVVPVPDHAHLIRRCRH
jgi:hypothetical protein